MHINTPKSSQPEYSRNTDKAAIFSSQQLNVDQTQIRPIRNLSKKRMSACKSTWTENDIINSTYFTIESQSNSVDEIPSKDIETLFQSNCFNKMDSTDYSVKETKILKMETKEIVFQKILPYLPIYQLKSSQDCILIFGGNNLMSSNIDKRNVYRYRPDLNEWDVVSLMPKAREYHSAVFFQKRIYVAGGSFPGSKSVRLKTKICNQLVMLLFQSITSSMWSFDPISRSWFTEQNMPEPRKNFGFIVAHLQIYAIGGEDLSGTPLDTVLCYDPVAATWRQVASMNVPRAALAVIKYKNFIWAVGGQTINNITTDSMECYDLLTNTWSILSGHLRVPRAFARMSIINDQIYIIGGVDDRSVPLAFIDVFDIKNKHWKLIDEMDIPRYVQLEI